MAAFLHGCKGGVLADLIVQPNASRTEIVGLYDGRLKVRVAGPPVDGKANAELCKYLAKKTGIPKSSVTVVKGASSRRKQVLFTATDPLEIQSKLGKYQEE